MKKTIFSWILSIAFTGVGIANTASTTEIIPVTSFAPPKITFVETPIYMGVTIHVTLTSSNGCVFTADGDFFIISRKFKGKVTIKCPGEPLCSYNFDFIIPESGETIQYEDGDLDAWNLYIEPDSDLKAEMAALILAS